MIVGYLPYLLTALLTFSPVVHSAAVVETADVAQITNASHSTDVAQASSALLGNCNGAAALLCCLSVVESTDLLAVAALALAGVIPPLIPTQVGLLCLPQTAELGHLCLTELVACDDNSHPGIGIDCNLSLRVR